MKLFVNTETIQNRDDDPQKRLTLNGDGGKTFLYLCSLVQQVLSHCNIVHFCRTNDLIPLLCACMVCKHNELVVKASAS